MKTPSTRQTSADVKDIGRRTLYQRLHLLSLGKGICIAVMLIALSIPLGNWRELNNKLDAANRVWKGTEIDGKKIPADEQTLIEQIIRERAGAASNLLTIMRRYPEAAVEQREALERARDVMRNAVDPASTARANTALQTCVSDAMNALIDQTRISIEDHELMQEAAAAFNEQGRKLAIRARDFDRQMQKAIDTYEGLPTRALFSKPKLFSEI